MSFFFLGARDENPCLEVEAESGVRRFPFSLCETAVVQTAEENSTEFVFDELRPSRPPIVTQPLAIPQGLQRFCLYRCGRVVVRDKTGVRVLFLHIQSDVRFFARKGRSATFSVFALRNGGCSDRRGKLAYFATAK